MLVSDRRIAPTSSPRQAQRRLAIYTYTRDGELRVLQRNDLEHAVINIVRAYNRRKPGELKGTKSDAARRFAVEPNLRPLLDAIRMESDGTGLVIDFASERAMARNIRRWLSKAGVRRAALHETNAQSQTSPGTISGRRAPRPVSGSGAPDR
jgi:hypothetical protein